jgi:tetratricopeptide (TPR) repeat protein
LALQSFENALSIDPNDGPARFNFAMSLVQGNYFAEAANELETFLQFDPNNIQGHLEVGKIYADKLRNIEKAAIHYKRAIGLNPEHPEAVNMRYWLIRNKAN